MRTSVVWKITCNILFILLEISSQDTVNDLSKLDDKYSLSRHYNNNSNVKKKLEYIVSNDDNSKIYSLNNNYNNIDLKNVDKKRQLHKNTLIKFKNDYFKLEPTSYIQNESRKKIYNKITPYNKKQVDIINSYDQKFLFSSFIENDNSVVEDNNMLDFIDVINEKGQVLFSMQRYYIDLYTMKEALLFTTFYKSMNPNMFETINQKISHFNGTMDMNINECYSGGKNRFNYLIHSLENATTYNYDKEEYDKKLSKYRFIIDNFYKCFEKKNNDIKNELNNITTDVSKMLNQLSCKNNLCNTEYYLININLYLLHLNENSFTFNDTYLSRAKNIVESTENLIKLIQNEMGNNQSLYSVMFVYDNLNVIIKRYNFHLNKMNYGKEHIIELLQKDNHNNTTTSKINNENISSTEYINKLFESVNLFSSYKYSYKILTQLNSLIIRNEMILNNLFNHLLKDIERKHILSHLNINNFDSKYNITISETESLLKSVADILKRNDKKQNINFQGVLGLNILIKGNMHSEKIIELNNAKKNLETLISSIKTIYNSIKSEKYTIENLTNNEIDKIDYIYKAQNLSSFIETIKNKEINISQNKNMIDSYYTNVQELEKQIKELCKNIESNTNINEKLKTDYERRNSYKTNIIKNLEYINTSVIDIKAIISLYNQIDNTVLNINELNNEKIINMENFFKTKEDIYNNIKTQRSNFYNNELNELISELLPLLEYNKTNVDYDKKTISELERIEEETKLQCDKLANIKPVSINNMLINMNNELNKLNTLKDDIIKKCLDQLNTDISNINDSTVSTVLELRNKINDYKEEIDDLENYKKMISNLEYDYLYNLHEDDSALYVIKNIDVQLEQYKDIIHNIKNKITHDIHIIKTNMEESEKKVKSHMDLQERLKKHVDLKETYQITLLPLNKNQIDKNVIKEYEQEFNKTSERIYILINDINNLNEHMNVLKQFNANVYGSNINVQMLKDFNIKEDVIIDKLNEHMKIIIESDSILGSVRKDTFLDAIKKQIQLVKNKFLDMDIKSLKKRAQDLLYLYLNSKTKYHDTKEINVELEENQNYNWKSIRNDIENMNTECEILDKISDELITEQKLVILHSLDKLIKEMNQKINNNINEYLKRSDDIINAIISFRSNININKYENEKYNQKINRLKELSTQLENKILETKKSLEHNKKNSNNFVIQAENVIKNNEKKIIDKQNIMNDIYNQIKYIFERIDNIDSKNSMTNVIIYVELNYEKLIYDYIYEQVENEETVSKTLMEEFKLYKEKIEELIQKDNQNKVLPFLKNLHYNDYSNKIKETYNNILKLVQNTKELNKLYQDSNDSTYKAKENNIEGEKYLKDIINYNNNLKTLLPTVKELKGYIEENNIDGIYKRILENIKKTVEHDTLAKIEYDKIESLYKALEMDFEKMNTIHNTGYEHLDIPNIEKQLKLIIQNKDNLTYKEKEIDMIFKKIKEYKEITLLHHNLVTEGKNTLDILIKDLSIDEESKSKYNMDELVKHMNEATQASNKTTEYFVNCESNKNKFSIKEKEFKDLLIESFSLLLKRKHEEIKNNANIAMQQINQMYSKLQEKLNESIKKLNNLKGKSHLKTKEEKILYNDKCKIAYKNVEIKIARIEHYLIQLSNISDNIDNILNKSKIAMNSIRTISNIETKIKSHNFNEEHINNIEHLNTILSEKENMENEEKIMNTLSNNIIELYNEIKNNKKDYEIGFLENIKMLADQKKKYIESTKGLLNSLINKFASLFNKKYLNKYNIQENVEIYNRKIAEKYVHFNNSFIIIENNMKVSINESIHYDEAKKIRETAERELNKIEQNIDEVKNYLKYIQKTEGFRLMYYMKGYLDNIYENCSKQHSNVISDHKYIKNIIEEMKDIEDEQISLRKYNEAIKKYTGMNESINCSNEDDIINIFGSIIKCVNFSGIKILSDIKSEIIPELCLDDISQSSKKLQLIILEPEMKSQFEGESNYEEKIKEAHSYSVNVLHYLNEIEEKKRESETLINTCKNIYNKTNQLHELKLKINDIINSKENEIIQGINNITQKIEELEQLKCNTTKYEEILDKKEYEYLNSISASYKYTKTNILFKTDIKKINENFHNNLRKLYDIKNIIYTPRANVDTSINIEQINILFDENHKNINSIQSDIRTINITFDELLDKGKKCEISLYNSICINIKNKIYDNIRRIKNNQEEAQMCLHYIENNITSLDSDIHTFNNYNNEHIISSYISSNIENTHEYIINLRSLIENVERINNHINKEFIVVNQNTDIESLQKKDEILLEFYNDFKKEEENINNIYKNIHIKKLKEIENSLEKYDYLTTSFNKMIETQKSNILKNENEFKIIENTTEDKKKDIPVLNNMSLKIESVTFFNQEYRSIMNIIQDIHNLEQTNYSERLNVKQYLEYISTLLGRINEFSKMLQQYEDNKITKENLFQFNLEEIHNNIGKLKEKINNVNNKFVKLMEDVKKNEESLKDNANIKNIINNIWKNIYSIKENISKNLPEKDKLLEIENELNDMKNIMNETKRISNINEYVKTNFHEGIGYKSKEDDYKNIEDINELLYQIKRDNKRVQDELLIINHANKKLEERINYINIIFGTISSTDENTIRKFAEGYVFESTKLYDQSKQILLKLNELSDHHFKEITYLDAERIKCEEKIKRKEEEIRKQEELKKKEDELVEKFNEELIENIEIAVENEIENIWKDNNTKSEVQQKLSEAIEEKMKNKIDELTNENDDIVKDNKQMFKDKLNDELKKIKEQVKKKIDKLIIEKDEEKQKEKKNTQINETNTNKNTTELINNSSDTTKIKDEENYKEMKTEEKEKENENENQNQNQQNDLVKTNNDEKDINNNDSSRNSNTNKEPIHMSTDKLVDINLSPHHTLDTKEVNNNSDGILDNTLENNSIIQEDIKNRDDNNTHRNNDYKTFQRGRSLNIVIYIAGGLIIFAVIFGSISFLIFKIYKTEKYDINMSHNTFIRNDDILFQNKDQMIEVVFNEYHYNQY
ncbi:reticulocyte binding protein 2 homologue a, putative [Plasmodium sp. DRC-Itaito]|nr:reticulocyte binding protein 2 homologue a, putative [Plasmodium sp. DRC-Itaito]